MKLILSAAIATGLIMTGVAAAPSEAEAKSKRHFAKKHSSRKWRRFSRREINRLPIRVTRPPNASHYIHQDFPLWAARAFQPTRNR